MPRAMMGAAAALGLVFAGCGSGTTASSGRSASERAAIEGKWYGKLAPSGQPGGAERELSKLYENSTVVLDLKPEGKFVFDMMGTPIEGSYGIEGDKLTLEFETIMGKPVDDPNSPIGFLGETFVEPEVGTIRDKGSAIFFPSRPGMSFEAVMTFTRHRPPAPPHGPKSVRAEEEKYVGTYVYDPRYELPKAETKAMEKAQEMLKNMMRGFRLELLSDNTFNLTMMLMMKGKWSLDGEELNLDVIEPEMKALTGSEPPIIRIRPSNIPGQLLMLNDKTGRVDIAIRRVPGGQ